MSTPPAWIDITSPDADRSRLFYGELFGWQIDVAESMDYGVISPAAAGLAGGIGPARDDSPHPPGVVVYFTVADLDVALARAGELGARTVVPPWAIPGLGRMAVVNDPDGNRIGLWQGGA